MGTVTSSRKGGKRPILKTAENRIVELTRLIDRKLFMIEEGKTHTLLDGVPLKVELPDQCI